jgi:hypothetical protein
MPIQDAIRQAKAKAKQTAFGYLVKTAKETGLSDYFKKNPKVAGMAWGGGENGSPIDEPRSVVSNPYNSTQSDPQKRNGLYLIEAARHKMSEKKYNPKFPLSQDQKKWQQTFGNTPYATNDVALKKSIVSRIIANDTVPGITQTQQVEADSLAKELWEADKK